MDRTLVIIASEYPFGFGEPYLEGELAILSQYFTKVYVVIAEEKITCFGE